MKCWLSDCGNFGISENTHGLFDVYYRLYSVLGNHDALWFPSYASARYYLKKEHFMDGRMKRIDEKEFMEKVGGRIFK